MAPHFTSKILCKIYSVVQVARATHDSSDPSDSELEVIGTPTAVWCTSTSLAKPITALRSVDCDVFHFRRSGTIAKMANTLKGTCTLTAHLTLIAAQVSQQR